MYKHRRRSGTLHLSAKRKRHTADALKAYWKRLKQEQLQPNEETLQELGTEPFTEDSFEISGRRIININFFIHELQALNRHSLDCGLSEMVILSERQMGFKSYLQFQCKICHFRKGIWTEDPEDKSKNVNSDAVVGLMSIGYGFWNLEKLFSTLDIPSLSCKMYTKECKRLSKAWEVAAKGEMEKAAEDENRIAIQCGEVEPDGTLLLTVVADRSWGKKSYTNNYSSLSGMAAIGDIAQESSVYRSEE